MKPYGLPRVLDLIYPDLADIARFGLKSSKSRMAKKSGDIPNSFRSPTAKSAVRRYWKRAERNLARKNIRERVYDYE